MKSKITKEPQSNKISIVKNKEIIIYQNGEEFKRFKQSETKELNEDELYILDFLLKKYSLYEIPPRSSKLNENDFEFESNDEIFKKRENKKKGDFSQTKKYDNSNNYYEEEEDRKTEPKLKEFFKDIEDENNGDENLKDTGREEMSETKKLKKGIRTTEDVKVPIQRKNKNMNYHYEEENVDIEEENQEEEESEEPPQYIVEVESYTSPNIKNIDEKIAENELLNGIKTCLMINGQDQKGIIFLGENETIIFVSFEGKKETIISLNNIKRIYFNIKGSTNLRNYKKKSNDRFIQFVELNNKKTDFKFNNDTELEYLIKGLIKTYRNKTPPIDKNLIYEKISKYFTFTNTTFKNETKETKNINTNKYIYHKNDKNVKNEKQQRTHYKRRNESNTEEFLDNKEENNFEKYEESNNQNNYYYEKDEKYAENKKDKEFYENNNNYQENYENNNDNYNDNQENNNDDDNFITTTKIEVFKDGKLINEETQEEFGGVVRTLHSYSPDVNEYEEYLRKSTLRKSKISNDELNRSLDRVNKFK